MKLPSHYQGVLLKEYGKPLVLESLPMPAVPRGHVLVQMAAAPINPSDLVFVRNLYGIRKTLPVTPGFEGSGVVVAGQGFVGKSLIGRRVACRAPQSGHGTWAEYMLCPWSACIPLLPSVSLEAGATALVNPLTALALLQLAKSRGHQAILQSAAGSAVGRMIGRLAREKRIQIVHIVRRSDHKKALEDDGESHVIDSSADDFERQLVDSCQRWRIRLALEIGRASCRERVCLYV